MSRRPYNLVVLALLLLSGVALAAWWTIQLQPFNTLSWKSLPPDISALPRFGNTLETETTGNQTLDRPLFWENRRPLPSQNVTAASTTHLVPMELLGIVTEGSRRVALLRALKGTPPLPVHRMHLGESFDGATIQSINTDSVTLKSSNGLQILRILRGSQGAPRETLIPSEKQIDKASYSPPEQAKPALSATELTKPGSDELKKHMENLKRKAAGQAQPPTSTPHQ